MSRITKDRAKEIALELLKSKREKRDEAKKELSELAYKEVLSNIPKTVLDFWKKHPEYLSNKSSWRFYGNGFNGQSITISEPLPYYDYSKSITPSESVAEELLRLENKYDRLRQEYYSLKQETEEVIYNLRTIKRINEAFPSLNIEDKKTSALAINVKELIKRIES